VRHELNEPASGAVVHLRAGDTLEVRLRQIGGTGYLWHLDALPGHLRLDADDVSGPGTSVAGAAGQRRFVLTALAEGDGVVELRLARPWEDHVEERRTVEVSVTT
jgi:predicted secreted protein